MYFQLLHVLKFLNLEVPPHLTAFYEMFDWCNFCGFPNIFVDYILSDLGEKSSGKFAEFGYSTNLLDLGGNLVLFWAFIMILAPIQYVMYLAWPDTRATFAWKRGLKHSMFIRVW